MKLIIIVKRSGARGDTMLNGAPFRTKLQSIPVNPEQTETAALKGPVHEAHG